MNSQGVEGMLAEAATHTGLVRQNNEDAYILIPKLQLYGVADGMGGHAAGEVASSLAVDALVKYIQRNAGSAQPEKVLAGAVQHANREIYRQAQKEPSRAGMGTTLSVAWVFESTVYLAHVGDSRIYLFRNDTLKLLTKDHSFVGEMMRNGNMTQEEAQHHPQRNLLTRALGIEQDVLVDTDRVSLKEQDTLLLCTDGLSSLLSSEEICQVLSNPDNLSSKLNVLIDLALKRGGHDNITVLLVQNT